MPRKPSFKKRTVTPDPLYGDKEVAQFINRMMLQGKKSVAERLFYGSLDYIGTKIKDKKPLEVFKKAIENVTPVVKVKARRIGGATYQVPEPVDKAKGSAIAHRWVIQSARREELKLSFQI